MTPTLLLAIAMPILSAPGGEPPTVFGAIEARYQAGLIDAETRLRYRVMAVRRPGSLPAALRGLPLARPGHDGRAFATRILAEAYRHVAREGLWGGALHALLQPPPDLTYTLDSAEWPIRVSYGTPSDEPLARAALASAETAWTVEIGSYGFTQPPTMDASDLYRIFIDNTGFGGGYTAPYEENPATPWTDCFTYIVLDPSNSQWDIAGVTAHEVNHSMQAAMDCYEVTTFWENTATYVMSQVFPDAWYYSLAFLSAFQSQPWRALDFMEYPNSDGYEYGGFLFAYYLAETFAPTGLPGQPKAALLARIWQASMQNGFNNEPDYYDGIETVLSDLGHDLTIEDVVVDFSEARYFVGSVDDGQHLPGAGDMWDGEVSVTAQHSWQSLPVRGATPPTGRQPAPFGSNHVVVTLPASAPRPLRVRFDGADDTRWAVRLVRTGRGETVSEDLTLAPETWDGSAIVDPTGFSKLLLVVVNLGRASYDPDSRSWPAGDYTYDIEAVLPPPTLEAIEPAEVIRGQQNVAMRLVGTGFEAGSELALQFEDPTLQVVSVEQVTPTEILFTLTVPRATTLGPKTVSFTNGDGTAVRGEGLLTVVESSVQPPGDDPKGCGCAAGTGADGGALLLLPFALLALGWRRRR